MNICILGAGNGGSTVAADLKTKGFTVHLIKTSSFLHNDHFNELLKTNGKMTLIDGEKEMLVQLDSVGTDVSIIKKADVIIIYIRTNYHRDLIKKIAPYLRDGQIIIFQPGYLSTAYLLQACPSTELTIVEAESSFIDCRIVAPGVVKVLFRNVNNPVGVFPMSQIPFVQTVLKPMDYHLSFGLSVAEAALHNPNLIVHTIGAIMSIPRIEYSKGNYSMYKEVFTPTVWNIVLSLDREKMKVLAALGFPELPYVEACKKRNSLDENLDAKDVFFDYAKNHSPSGPHVPDSRYITEDVPEGLVLLESLGKMFDIPTPTCSALIDLAGAALRRNFRSKGRTVDTLGREYIARILASKN